MVFRNAVVRLAAVAVVAAAGVGTVWAQNVFNGSGNLVASSAFVNGDDTYSQLNDKMTLKVTIGEKDTVWLEVVDAELTDEDLAVGAEAGTVTVKSTKSGWDVVMTAKNGGFLVDETTTPGTPVTLKDALGAPLQAIIEIGVVDSGNNAHIALVPVPSGALENAITADDGISFATLLESAITSASKSAVLDVILGSTTIVSEGFDKTTDGDSSDNPYRTMTFFVNASLGLTAISDIEGSNEVGEYTEELTFSYYASWN